MESVLDDLEAAIAVNEKDGHPADPASPTVPVQVKNEPNTPSTTETDDERIILTLESLHYSTETTESAKKLEENQRALEKLDKLLQTNNITRKKIVKHGNGEKNSNASLVAVKAATEKRAPRILNATLAKSPNPDSKRLLNNIGKSIPSEEDLLAILEGNNQDEETEVDVKVIEDAGNKKTVTTVLLSKNQELKIAADQIKEISRKSNSKQNIGITTNEVTSSANELINAIVSEWSDTEREISEEKIEMTLIPKQSLKQNLKKRKVESKVVVVSTSANSNEDEKEIENVNVKIDKPEIMTGIAPFKRSRIIKKKIIWDPDAPETQFSYASLIKPKAKQNATKRVASKGAVSGTVNKSENGSFSKKVTEKKAAISGRKRKEVSPDKSHDKLQEALNEILSEEINSAIKSSTKDSVASPVKSKEMVQAKKPRMTKAKQTGGTSSSWDYINKGRSDEMMIIRRRSSSYSSTASQRRVSAEQQQQLQTNSSPKSIKVLKKVGTTEQFKTIVTKKKKQEIQLKKVTATNLNTENQENSVKILPVVKKLSIAETKKLAPPSPTLQTTSVNKKLSKQISVADADKGIVSLSTNLKSQKVEKKVAKVSEDKPKPDIEVILKRSESVVNFIIDLKPDNPSNTFSMEFIKKFVSTLEHLKKDNSCKVVVISSKGAHFCQGIDFSCLVTPSIEKRKVIANELAKNVKLLFETLINFNKPIIAAVGGLVSNLGVTMLPLFDLVFASDKCAFEMTYSKIGQIPEGNCILNTINMDKKYKMKLLYLAEKLTPNEALSAGLLSVVHPVQRFEAEAINTATKMASLSQQAYKSMRQSCLKSFTNETFTRALEEELKCLVDHYISAECQEKFKELMKK